MNCLEELKRQLDFHQIEHMLLDYPHLTNQQIEKIDEMIALALNKAMLKVEG